MDQVARSHRALKASISMQLEWKCARFWLTSKMVSSQKLTNVSSFSFSSPSLTQSWRKARLESYTHQAHAHTQSPWQFVSHVTWHSANMKRTHDVLNMSYTRNTNLTTCKSNEKKLGIIWNGRRENKKHAALLNRIKDGLISRRSIKKVSTMQFSASKQKIHRC